jgi:glycine hydroxymethyltransferase
LDYDELLKIAMEAKPNIIVAGFTAYPRKIDWKKFRAFADACGAYLMVDMSHIAGLVAGGAHPSPFPHADIVTTTTHKTLRGPRGALIFARKELPKGKTEGPTIDALIDKAVFPGLQGGPHENAVAAIAVALNEAMSPKFAVYAKQIVQNAKALSDELIRLGWRVTSGGTDNHLFLVDTWARGVDGKEASERLEQAGIIVNMNTIPFDQRKPMDPSGIRIGCAAETTRGAKEKDMIRLAARIDMVLKHAA